VTALHIIWDFDHAITAALFGVKPSLASRSRAVLSCRPDRSFNPTLRKHRDQVSQVLLDQNELPGTARNPFSLTLSPVMSFTFIVQFKTTTGRASGG
jgi:hypothetical protein